MADTDANRPTYNVALMRNDMTLKGWLATDLARYADLSDQTVSRFFRGEPVTAPTAKKLAEALGYSVRRYLIPSRQEATL